MSSTSGGPPASEGTAKAIGGADIAFHTVASGSSSFCWMLARGAVPPATHQQIRPCPRARRAQMPALPVWPWLQVEASARPHARALAQAASTAFAAAR